MLVRRILSGLLPLFDTVIVTVRRWWTRIEVPKLTA
jgi:hypothetical protein